MAPWCELNLAFFHDRRSVLEVVVPVAAANVTLGARQRQADRAEAAARLRVVDIAFRGRDVTGPPTSAANLQGNSTVTPEHFSRSAAFLGRRSGLERDVAARARHGPRRNLLGDHVDQPTDRVGAVEERGRSPHDFNALGRRGVHRDAVIGRLAGQVAHALAVLQDQHAVAVETADDRPRRRGPEAARREARLVLERRSQ